MKLQARQQMKFQENPVTLLVNKKILVNPLYKPHRLEPLSETINELPKQHVIQLSSNISFVIR